MGQVGSRKVGSRKKRVARYRKITGSRWVDKRIVGHSSCLKKTHRQSETNKNREIM